MEITNLIKPHPLYRCKDSTSFIESLEEYISESLFELLSKFVIVENVYSVHLVSSIPLGIGTNMSDIDFYIIGKEDCLKLDNKRRDNSVKYSRSNTDTVIAECISVVNGVKFDFEILNLDRINELSFRLENSNPVYTLQELTVLSRLKTGWKLHIATDKCENLDYLTSLNSNKLNIYSSTFHYMVALSRFKDSINAIDNDKTSSLMMAKSCIENSYISYISSIGVPYPGQKWIRYMNPVTSPMKHCISKFFFDSLHLLFPSLNETDEAVNNYLKDVREFMLKTRALMEEDLEYKIAFSLNKQISTPKALT